VPKSGPNVYVIDQCSGFRDRFPNLAHGREVSIQRILEVPAGLFRGISNRRTTRHIRRERGVASACWLNHQWVTSETHFRQ